jgi:hypothetical protein
MVVETEAAAGKATINYKVALIVVETVVVAVAVDAVASTAVPEAGNSRGRQQWQWRQWRHWLVLMAVKTEAASAVKTEASLAVAVTTMGNAHETGATVAAPGTVAMTAADNNRHNGGRKQ